MAKMVARGVELEAIDRLETKLRQVVEIVDRMKDEKARMAEENQRLARDLDAARGRLAATDQVSAELTALKEERDVIRTRVTEMLEQLEALDL
jgi:regulator of replication initiation timing